MSYAPDVEGYEDTVDVVKKVLGSGSFVPMGDPAKAAKVMIDLVEHPAPPIHLVLDSEAIAILQQADANRKADLEKWLPVSTSTDHDEAVNLTGNNQLADLKLKEALLLLLQVNPELKNILFDFSEPGKINLEGFMNKNYHFNVELKRFAYLTGRSLATFKRDFEKIFNVSPSR